jgi:hypothetical protein
MESCWAFSLGDCDGVLSKEHLVSHGIFPNMEVFVQGFPWCVNEPKQIAHANFVKKCLCEKHNRDLSSVDVAGINAMNIFREGFRRLTVLSELKPKRYTLERAAINGFLWERWLLKTLIDLAYETKFPVGADATLAGLPSERLIRIAFGYEKLEGRAGVYALLDPVPAVREDRITIKTFTWQMRYVVAANFSMHGIDFLLFLDEKGPPENMQSLSSGGDRSILKPVSHRTKRLVFSAHDYPTTIVDLDWS